MKKKFLAILTLLLSLLLVAYGEEKKTETNPETYPDKPVNVIIAYKAGGGTDVGARILMAEFPKQIRVWQIYFWTFNSGNLVGFSRSRSFIYFPRGWRTLCAHYQWKGFVQFWEGMPADDSFYK